MSGQVRTGVRLAADPVLPHRDVLLDDAHVAGRLEELSRGTGRARSVQGCTRVRARYRPGQSLRGTFEVADEEGTRLVSARMFPPGKVATQFASARDAADREGAPADAVLLDAALDTVFWVFPQDRKLRGLAEVVSPHAELRGAFGVPWTSSELVAYTPEKAATVRCRDDAGSTVGFAKVHVDGDWRRSVDSLTAVRERSSRPGAPRLPEVLGYLPERQLAVFSPVPGRPLHQLPRAAVPDAMTALGAALAVLHRGETDRFPRFTRLAPGAVVEAGTLLARVRPDVADLCGSVLAVLVPRPPEPAAAALLHGDLHPKNVLVDDDRVGLVDLDQAAGGPPAAELGGVLARLWSPRPSDEIDAVTAAAAADALLSAYERRPSERDLLWYAAAALVVERALRAVNRVDVPTLADLEQVLTTALRWATRPGGRP